MTPPYVPPTVPWKQAESYMYKAADGSIITGHLTYGGFAFPSAVSLKFTVEPVYDSSNRFPKWWKHTFTIETVIDPMMTPEYDSTGLNPVDQNFSQFRRLLQTPGLVLEIYGAGVGQNQRTDNVGSPSGVSPTGVAANASYPTSSKQDPLVSAGDLSPILPDVLTFRVASNNDLNFGPRPTLLVCEPIGAARVWRIVWSVEVALPTCCVAFSTNTGTICLTPTHLNSPAVDTNNNLIVTEFNYAMAWSIDEERFTTRTITGAIEVQGWMGVTTKAGLEADHPTNAYAGMVLNQRLLADRLRKSFAIPPGFIRDMQYDMSRDKRKLEFRLTDREIPSDNPYFANILECNATAEVEGNPLGANFNFTISGNYKIQPGVAKAWAYLAFLFLIYEKLKYLQLATAEVKTTVGPKYDISYRPGIMPRTVRMKEDLYARTCQFSFRFTVFCSLHQVLFATGMFNRLPGTWQTWTNNQSPSMKSHIGDAEVTFGDQKKNESMSQVCNNQRLADDASYFNPQKQNNEQYIFNVVSCPPPNQSWADYKPVYEITAENKNYPIAPVPYLRPKYSQDLRAQDPNIIGNVESIIPSLGNAAAESAGFVFNSPTDDKYVWRQTQGPGKYHITSRGYAVRLCYNVAAPALTAVTTMQGSNVVQEVPIVDSAKIMGPFRIGYMGPVPLLAWAWETVYSVIGQPVGDAISLITTDGVPEYFLTKFFPKAIIDQSTPPPSSPNQNY